jgi:hypothetical protein
VFYSEYWTIDKVQKYSNWSSISGLKENTGSVVERWRDFSVDQ